MTQAVPKNNGASISFLVKYACLKLRHRVAVALYHPIDVHYLPMQEQ